ncbi:unnamed protein product [Ilex paraguariensis]|uniref:Uncharacterized protein n=1 Tax=Ilex paraguariensis TaxID=185542 RepID=A0ABC8SJ87_9AQUA
MVDPIYFACPAQFQHILHALEKSVTSWLDLRGNRMDNGEIEGSDDNEIPTTHGRVGRKYSPVVAHDSDRAVLEMSSLDPESSSSSFPNRGNPLK